MKQVKKVPRQQLEKFSVIFMQLGLVLVLFVVFISLEYKTEQKETAAVDIPHDPTNVFVMDPYKIPVYIKEEVKVKQQRRQESIAFLNEVTPVEDNNDAIETPIISDPDKDMQEIDIDAVVTVAEPDEIEEEDEPKPLPMTLVSKIPVFKGCENLSKEASRKCFDKKIGKLVNRHFDTDLANVLGLKEGKHKMYTQFVIDKKGKVIDVKVGTKEKRLEKEAKRVIGKIPDFTPGESNGKKVSVKYTLPINFYVE